MNLNSNNIAMLTQGYKANFNTGMGTYTPMYTAIATVVPSSTSEEIYPWMGMSLNFVTWLGDRAIQNLKQYDWRVKNVPFELTVGVDRDRIEDDSYGVFSPMMEYMGYEAARHPDVLTFALLPGGFTALCYDGQSFFDVDHPVGNGTVSNHQGGSGNAWYILDTTRPIKPFIFQKRKDYKFVSLTNETDHNVFMRKEYLYGSDARVNASYAFWQFAYASKQPLTEANVAAAIAAMKNFRGDNGAVIGVQPNIIIVNPTDEVAAEKIVTAVYSANGASNVMANKLKVMSSALVA